MSMYWEGKGVGWGSISSLLLQNPFFSSVFAIAKAKFLLQSMCLQPQTFILHFAVLAILQLQLFICGSKPWMLLHHTHANNCYTHSCHHCTALSRPLWTGQQPTPLCCCSFQRCFDTHSAMMTWNIHTAKVHCQACCWWVETSFCAPEDAEHIYNYCIKILPHDQNSQTRQGQWETVVQRVAIGWKLLSVCLKTLNTKNTYFIKIPI